MSGGREVESELDDSETAILHELGRWGFSVKNADHGQ